MTDAFAAHRERLFALAYRMLGSAAEAEDVLQDAWLRWQGAQSIESPGAWLTTVTTRLCLDHLKSARVRREQYVGPWLPEPIATPVGDGVDPETISIAFLLVLERLSPSERAVYLLHKVFDLDYPEIAATLGKSEAAVRQLFHRAGAHLAHGRPRYAPTQEEHLRLLTSFLVAVQSGEFASVQALLAEDARAVTDGGGHARAALNVVAGRERVAKLFLGLVKKGDAGADARPELREVNGWPALMLWQGERLHSVVTIETDGQTIYAVHVVVNPEKLRALAITA